MTEIKAKVVSIEYHKPEYHISIEIYIDNALDSETVVTISDYVDINTVKEIVKDKLREIKNALSLGSQLDTYVGQEIIL